MNALEQELAITDLQGTGKFQILRKVELDTNNNFTGRSVPEAKVALILDTETTGFDADTCKIIELGIVAVEYDPATGDLIRVVGRYSGFEDPGEPLSQEIIDVTGITDEMLAGQSFDDQAVQSLLGLAVLVVAHNSKFDRPFIETRFPSFKHIAWGCSLEQIDWQGEKLSARVLEYILFKFGWFINAHRALDDAEGLLCALLEKLPISGERAFKALLEKAREPICRVYAVNAPFDKKDLLKQRGYRWSDGSSGIPKCWWTSLPESQELEELAYLANEIYPGGNTKSVDIKRIGPRDRFSKRDV